MPTLAELVSDLEQTLSRERLESYRPAGGSHLDMVVNYFWNIDLAEALVPSLHAAELALRNSIANILTADRGTDVWFYEPGLLEPGQLQQFAHALVALSRRKVQPTGGRIVAQLTFGFWVTLLRRTSWRGSRYRESRRGSPQPPIPAAAAAPPPHHLAAEPAPPAPHPSGLAARPP